MKLLFIDHECHRKTGSAAFFLDIVRKSFEVDEHYYSRYYRTGSEDIVKDYDGVIIWEFPVSRRKFFFSGKRNIFVPMYDNEWASYWQWKRIAWSGMGVISFCDKVTRHARKCGVTNLLDVRYFPDPVDYPQRNGDTKRVFLWERGEISYAVAEKLFPPEAGYVFDVKGADEFLERDEYLERIAKCGIVIAPRRKEGIGMAFLEAMAMGKCVVAHNEATMNEYIKDGENGILFDADNPLPVSEEKIRKVLDNLAQSAVKRHLRWMEDKVEIPVFLRTQTASRLLCFDKLKMMLSYPLYVLEGATHKLVGNYCKGKE